MLNLKTIQTNRASLLGIQVLLLIFILGMDSPKKSKKRTPHNELCATKLLSDPRPKIQIPVNDRRDSALVLIYRGPKLQLSENQVSDILNQNGHQYGIVARFITFFYNDVAQVGAIVSAHVIPHGVIKMLIPQGGIELGEIKFKYARLGQIPPFENSTYFKDVNSYDILTHYFEPEFVFKE